MAEEPQVQDQPEIDDGLTARVLRKASVLFRLDEELESLKARLDLLEQQRQDAKQDSSTGPTKIGSSKKQGPKPSIVKQAISMAAMSAGGIMVGLSAFYLIRISKRQNASEMYPALMQMCELAKQVLARKMAQAKTKPNVVPLHNRGPGKLRDPQEDPNGGDEEKKTEFRVDLNFGSTPPDPDPVPPRGVS